MATALEVSYCLFFVSHISGVKLQEHCLNISRDIDYLAFYHFLMANNMTSYYMASSWADRMNEILRCDWLPKRARWSYVARSGLPAVSSKKKITPICLRANNSGKNCRLISGKSSKTDRRTHTHGQ